MQTVGWKQVLSTKLWHGEYSTRASDGLFLLFASSVSITSDWRNVTTRLITIWPTDNNSFSAVFLLSFRRHFISLHLFAPHSLLEKTNLKSVENLLLFFFFYHTCSLKRQDFFLMNLNNCLITSYVRNNVPWCLNRVQSHFRSRR